MLRLCVSVDLMSATEIVVAIDGPAGSGKSSVSKAIAAQFDFAYIDTGATYRAMAWWVLAEGIDPTDAETVAARCEEPRIDLATDPAALGVRVDGVDVSRAIREGDVTGAVSHVSAVPQVRARMVQMQRDIVARAAAQGHGSVVEGRDIASVVFPNAPVKVFLTADTEIRAQRRALEDQERAGGAVVDVGSTVAGLEQRDALDSGRAVSPLTRLADAVHIDATHLTLPEVVALVADLVVSAGSIMRENGPHG